MSLPNTETVPNLLVNSIPKDLVLGIEDALVVGSERAHTASIGMNRGHLPHVVGQLRHFHMNESFFNALTAGNASPSPIRGNGIVTGQSGLFLLARFNIPNGIWINGRRSACRRQLSEANKALEPLVHYDLFTEYERPTRATAFFVTCFPKFSHNSNYDTPTSIYLAVPDSSMTGWLFKESIDVFMKRYDDNSDSQVDRVTPKLKKNIGKQEKNGGTS